MRHKKSRLIPSSMLIILGVLIIWLANSQIGDVLAGAFIGVGLLWPILYGKSSPRKKISAEEEEENDETKTRPIGNLMHDKEEQEDADELVAIASATPLGTEYRKKMWVQTENIVDDILDGFIDVIKTKIACHTIAIFFPAPNNCYALRKYISKSSGVKENAIITPRRGLLGSIITDGLRSYYEPSFANKNATLYYYNEDYEFTPEENVRSIIVSPIHADGESKGILLADSTSANAFSEDDKKVLDNLAMLMGQAVYYTYKATKHNIDYKRLATMSNIEKDFWKELDFNIVMDKMCSVIPCAVPCDRLTISLKDEEKMSASIVRVHGENTQGFHKLNFQIGGENSKSIASLAYSTDFGFFRNFNEDRYEIRYCEDEPQSMDYNSFMVVPFGVDKFKGLMFMEAVKKDAFSKFNVDLLSRMGTSAGLALEKIFIIQKAESLATHDGLTGLYNHRHFQKILHTKISACARYKEPLSLVLCDIDFFKKINDTYGHPFGDLVLKNVAAKLESCIRVDIDAAARYGGEEFVLIFDKTDHEKARELVERIRIAISEMTFRTSAGEEVKRTMSFGIASYPHHAREIKDLISRADKALYNAKKNGRNRVEVY